MCDIVSNKTLFLLDCSNRFCSTNCGQKYDIDQLNRNRQSAITPFVPITKSLYTCSVEAIFEYSRIVWDLFPNGEKLLRFFSCSFDSVCNINNWDTSQQNYDKLVDAFASLPINFKKTTIKEPTNSVRHLINGFSEILSALSTYNDLPQSNQNYYNSGRVILISNFSNEATLNLFKEESLRLFESHNQQLFAKLKQTSNTSMNMINYLDIVVLNTVPIDCQSNYYFNNIPKHKLSDKLFFTVYSVLSGFHLSGKLTYLAFDHYDLASTTVSGIPMKEEQNAGSSANYDVEIVHSKKVHSYFFTREHNLDYKSFYSDHYHDGKEYKTLILKWSTPKSNASDLNYCTGAYRMTAVDVNSRPSSCLINFLFSGKTVNLEMTMVKSNKLISHVLQSHNGELFIHILSNIKLPIDDQPSISEGVGGRITDYRINEFADFMKKHRLVKLPPNNDVTNLEQATILLKDHTLYWPISYGFTVFFNIRDQLQNFYQIISKQHINDNEVLELKNIIYDLVGNESKGVNLPIQSSMIRIKGLKKEDVYRILWNEMEHIIQCFNQTPQHQSVLQCLLDCRPNCDPGRNTAILMLKNNISLNQTKNDKSNSNGEINNNKEDSKKICLNIITPSSQSLYDLYVDKMTQKNLKRRREFIGRINNEGKIAKLYADMNID